MDHFHNVVRHKLRRSVAKTSTFRGVQLTGCYCPIMVGK